MAKLRQGQPLVDIGIPTHGQPRYLCEAVESVLNQTFDSWQLVISENGPGNDEIRAILKPYVTDPRVHHVTVGSDISGPQNATRSIQEGSAAYVAVLHDDDRWDSGYLGKRAAFLSDHPTCGFAFSHFRFIDGSGNTVAPFDAGCREGVQPRSEFLRALYRRNFIGPPTVMFRRSAYQAVGSAFSTAVLFVDHLMWLRLATLFDAGFLDVRDADYRVHRGQTTQIEFARMAGHRHDLLNAVDEFLPEGFPSVERRRARAGAYLRGCVEAWERGDRRGASRDLLSALNAHPRMPLDISMLRTAARAYTNRSRQRHLWQR